MKPQNYKERNIAFFKFVLLFSAACGLIVLAVFFGTRMPFQENAYLREKMRKLEEQVQTERRFAGRMEGIRSLLDSMDMPHVNPDYMQQLISSELAEVQSSIPQNDSTYRQQMYSNIVQTYLELKTAKHSLIKMEDVKLSMEEYTKLIEQYNTDLKEAQRDLDICRQLNRK